jgi:hypothetical protein
MAKDLVYGTGDATNSGADATVIAAPTGGKRMRLRAGFVAVYAASTGGTGLCKLEDGVNGTVLFKVDGSVTGCYPFVFEKGPALSKNTLLNLTVEGATTQASAFAQVECEVEG